MNGWSMLFRSGAACLAALGLTGCGDRQGSVEAALALAEANYPGQLELYDSYLQKDHYDVALAVKGDPVTRIRFGIDRDPAQCRPGTRCEERLHRAYASGIAAGIKLKALDTGFRSCGVPVLGIDDADVTPAFRTLIELDMDVADQQPALDRLTECVAAFRAALPPDADRSLRALSLRVLAQPESGPTAMPALLTFEHRLTGKRQDEPSYLIGLDADRDRVSIEDLRLYPHYLNASGLNKTLAEVASRALAKDPQGGHVPPMPLIWQSQLDPQRLDVIRAYVLVCSEARSGKGPCRTDVAVRMRYDMTRGEASELSVIRGIRDAGGSVVLPELPGR